MRQTYTTSLWKRKDYKAEWAKFDADYEYAHYVNREYDQMIRYDALIQSMRSVQSKPRKWWQF